MTCRARIDLLEPWRERRDGARRGIAQAIALEVPRRAAKGKRRKLHVRGHDVPAGGREIRIGDRRDRQLDPRLVGKPAVFRRIERALHGVHVPGEPHATGERRSLADSSAAASPVNLGSPERA